MKTLMLFKFYSFLLTIVGKQDYKITNDNMIGCKSIIQQ